MRPCIFIRRLNRAQARQAVITGDPIAAFMEGLEEIVKRDPPTVMPRLAVLEERLEALGLEIVPHQAGLRQAHDTIRRLDPRDRMQALAHPKGAIRTMADGIEQLVRITNAETGHQHGRLIGFAVAILIRQEQQAIKVANEDRRITSFVSQRFDALDHRQAFGETHRFVGLTIAVRVFEPKDVIPRFHARNGLRVSRRAADIKSTFRIPRHLRRLGHAQGFVGKEIHFETVGHLERREFFRGGHDLLRTDDGTGLRRRRDRLLPASQGQDMPIPFGDQRLIRFEILLQGRRRSEAFAIVLRNPISIDEGPISGTPAIRPEPVFLDDRRPDYFGGLRLGRQSQGGCDLAADNLQTMGGKMESVSRGFILGDLGQVHVRKPAQPGDLGYGRSVISQILPMFRSREVR